MIRKAGALADRVILNLYPTRRVKRAVGLIEEGRRDAGKRDRATVSVMLYAHVLGDDEKGLQAAKELVAFYASAPAYSALFSSIGYADEAKVMSDAWRTKDKESVKRAVTRGMIDDIMVLGNIRELRNRVKSYHEEGVEDVFISPSPFAAFGDNVNEVLKHYF
jgi:alkanesulfonate monooxygenase SsuD/methylene tetrahydromethanopterin reductase-like flavin-dependent oxidoreductase (luciferase family)